MGHTFLLAKWSLIFKDGNASWADNLFFCQILLSFKCVVSLYEHCLTCFYTCRIGCCGQMGVYLNVAAQVSFECQAKQIYNL